MGSGLRDDPGFFPGTGFPDTGEAQKKAGDGTRTRDNQLGRLAFYR